MLCFRVIVFCYSCPSPFILLVSTVFDLPFCLWVNIRGLSLVTNQDVLIDVFGLDKLPMWKCTCVCLFVLAKLSVRLLRLCSLCFFFFFINCKASGYNQFKIYQAQNAFVDLYLYVVFMQDVRLKHKIPETNLLLKSIALMNFVSINPDH